MFESLILTTMLTWGTETLDTPFGEIDAHVNQQMVSVQNLQGWTIEGYEMSINPDIGNKMSMTDFAIGKSWKYGTVTVGEDIINVRGVYPVYGERVYGIAGATFRDRVDRAAVGIGYKFTDNIFMHASYGQADYKDGFDSDFTALSLVFVY